MAKEEIWCLGIWEQSTDYILCNGNSDLLPKLYKKDEIRFEYNQRKRSRGRVSCTIFAAMWAVSDLTNYEFSETEAKNIDDTSYNNPEYAHIRLPWKWWYVSCAVNHMRKWWNGNEELVKKYWKLASYRISKYDDEMIEDAINNLYTIDWNLCPTAEYILDYTEDWMVDGTNFWYDTNWHSLCVICKDWQRSAKDNYKWTAHNIYWLKNKLSKITNFWPYFYVFTLVKEDNLEEIKRLNEFKTNLLNATELNSKMRHQTKDTNYQSILHYMNEKNRKKLQDCEDELRKLI